MVIAEVGKRIFPVAGWFLYWDCPSRRVSWSDVVSHEIGKKFVRSSGRKFVEDVLEAVKEVEDIVWRVQRGFDKARSETFWRFYIGRVKVRNELKVSPFNLVVYSSRDYVFEDGRFPQKLKQVFEAKAREYRDSEKASWISWQVVRHIIYDLAGLRVRQEGGIYFVLEKFADEVDAVERFLKALDFSFNRIGVVDEAKTRECLFRVLEDEVNRVEKEISEYIERVREGMRLSRSGFERRYNELKAQREKLVVYKELGEGSVARLSKILEGLEDMMVRIRFDRAIFEESNEEEEE